MEGFRSFHVLSISLLLGSAQSELSGSDFSRGFLLPTAVADKQLQWSCRAWHRQGWNSFYCKCRAQNETLVCTGESTVLTGVLPASRAPLSF